MKTGIRLTRENLHLVADSEGVTIENLYNDVVDAKLAFKKQQDKEWSCRFFGKNEQWYDKTMAMVEKIKEEFDSNINPKEATIKMYGWIDKNGKKNLSMPMIHDKNYPEYAHAVAVEYILTNPDSYLKMMSWN